MQEVTIKGKKRICFIVAEGAANKLVIPFDGLAPIDYRRIAGMEAKGGSLLKVMRDTVCDNNVNALKMYKGLIITVPVQTRKQVDVQKSSVPTNSVRRDKQTTKRVRRTKQQIEDDKRASEEASTPE